MAYVENTYHVIIALVVVTLLMMIPAKANDGAYYTSGNQLIPMVETDIRITHERLTLIRNGGRMNVTVDYIFDNPGPTKTLVVGFEAMPPQGDVNTTPISGRHPYMHDFTVQMNDRDLPYQVTITSKDPYYEKGQIITETILPDEFNRLYVYHFDAVFQPGTNRILHTYSFDLSGSVVTKHDFEYVLTAANRWGANGIENFELSIDMGEMIEFNIRNSFFKDAQDWQISGIGTAYPSPDYYDDYDSYNPNLDTPPDYTTFAMRDGKITMEQTNFKPAGELYLWVPSIARFSNYSNFNDARFDASKDQLPFNLLYMIPTNGVDDASNKVLRNYLFARRGYVFANANLQNYFSKLPWYIPDPIYVPDLSALSATEQAWYKRLTDQ
ncbi:YARHG domain-containing protein [Parasulfitobacter algicola]|uniref:YARHG domain-containing protein n=1 Tax=Parasulfitobacter algicola TaxID=2614809 RepID=A0ABX2INN6_9RHOB|nr:YARHG domain-containing protein [Sulfitobacter algicola]NSX54165.1 YARHG domain-containing protein [Sulfitobacter algicola]